MERLRPWSVAALVGWTLFTWGNRIPLLWADSDQSTSAKLMGSIPIAIFVLLALTVLVLLLRNRGPDLAGPSRTVALGLAGWSIAYWLVRLPLILVHDHPVPFKLVHSVLAAVAVGLSISAVRRVTHGSPRHGELGYSA